MEGTFLDAGNTLRQGEAERLLLCEEGFASNGLCSIGHRAHDASYNELIGRRLKDGVRAVAAVVLRICRVNGQRGHRAVGKHSAAVDIGDILRQYERCQSGTPEDGVGIIGFLADNLYLAECIHAFRQGNGRQGLAILERCRTDGCQHR